MKWLPVAALLVIPFQESKPGRQEQQPEPVVQPIAFSHKQHARLGLDCAACHPAAKTAATAGLPGAKECAACHGGNPQHPELKKLAGYAQEGKDIPWVRIYKVPYYVFFSHQNHIQAKLECAACHGPVAEREILWKEKDLSMDGCIGCHNRQQTSTECHLCHALEE